MWILDAKLFLIMIQTQMIVFVCFAFIVIIYKHTVKCFTISNISNLKLQKVEIIV